MRSVRGMKAVAEIRAAMVASLQPVIPFAVRAPVDPMTLPTLQRAGLMRLHESTVSRTVYRRLLEDSQDYPKAREFHALSDLGLCDYNPGKQQRDLTSEGRIAAKALEKALCTQFDIHLMLGPKGTGPEVSFSCPCGWSAIVRNSHTAPGNARASFNRHHRTAGGMQKLFVALKPPTMAAEG